MEQVQNRLSLHVKSFLTRGILPRTVGLAAAVSLLAFMGAACLEFAPPPSGDVTPTPTREPTPTVEPTATVVPPTPTLTSTVTPTATATRTPTPEIPRLTINPITGLPEVAAFPPPTGSPLPASGIPQPAAVPAVPGSVVAPKPASAVDGASNVSPVWGCDGDERIDFVPVEPRPSDKIFIFVTGKRDRAFASLIGPQVSGVVGQTAPGGSGLKKVWEFTTPNPGTYTFYFYGGPFPEHLCVSASLRVSGSAGSASAGLITATPTITSTPVGTPRPDH